MDNVQKSLGEDPHEIPRGVYSAEIWTCVVCLTNDFYPMTSTKCGHSICHECSKKDIRKCPTCREKIGRYVPNYAIGSLLDKEYKNSPEKNRETGNYEPGYQTHEPTYGETIREARERVDSLIERRKEYIGLHFVILFILTIGSIAFIVNRLYEYPIVITVYIISVALLFIAFYRFLKKVIILNEEIFYICNEYRHVL